MTTRLVLRTITLCAVLTVALDAQQTIQQPKPTEAVAVTAESTLPFKVSVAGLSAQNATAVRDALVKLTRKTYVCDPCKVESPTAGECRTCKTPLKEAVQPLLIDVATAPQDSSIQLTMDARCATKLSDIEATLQKSSVTIDPLRTTLPGRIILVVLDGSADKLQAVQKALLEAKLFDEAVASFDMTTNQIRVAVSGKSAPTRGAVAATLEKQKMRLGDVVFGKAVVGG